MNHMRTFAFIPARGGSKRFPGKNLYPLHGTPLIAYPIRAALAAKGIERVIVSTDSEEIAQVARTHGADVITRPAELATDDASVVSALVHTYSELERGDWHPTHSVLLQATTPLVEPGHIQSALALAEQKGADSVVSVSIVDTINHPYNIRVSQPDGTVRFWQEDLHYSIPEKERPVFYRAAHLWLSKREVVLESGRLEGLVNVPLIVPPVYGVDIDFKEDLERIEAWLRYKKSP